MHESLRRLGFDVIRYSGTNFLERRRHELLREYRVDLVFDVGANTGQFGAALRRAGYRGRIVSFEPLPEAFQGLMENTDDGWDAHCVALGDGTGTSAIHRARNSWSSSLLPMTQRHLDAAPESAYVGDLGVDVRKLDDYYENRRIFLKIDTQGYEGPVLRGGSLVVRSAPILEVELSVTPLYEGQSTIAEVLSQLAPFDLAAIEPGFRDPRTKDILQLEALFVRRR